MAKVRRSRPLPEGSWDLEELGVVQHTSRWGTIARAKGSKLRYYPGCPWEKTPPSRRGPRGKVPSSQVPRIVAHVWEQRISYRWGTLVQYYAGFYWEGGNGYVMAIYEVYNGPSPAPSPIPSRPWKWPTIEEVSPKCFLVKLRWPNGKPACRYIYPTTKNLCGDVPSSCWSQPAEIRWGPDTEKYFAGSRIWRNVYVGGKGWQGPWKEWDTWEWTTEAPPSPGDSDRDIVVF